MAGSRGMASELAVVGGWELVRKAGEGASSVVYEGKKGGRRGAVKVLGEGFGLEEAELLARLDRVWGPALLDAGRDGAGRSSSPSGSMANRSDPNVRPSERGNLGDRTCGGAGDRRAPRSWCSPRGREARQHRLAPAHPEARRAERAGGHAHRSRARDWKPAKLLVEARRSTRRRSFDRVATSDRAPTSSRSERSSKSGVCMVSSRGLPRRCARHRRGRVLPRRGSQSGRRVSSGSKRMKLRTRRARVSAVRRVYLALRAREIAARRTSWACPASRASGSMRRSRSHAQDPSARGRARVRHFVGARARALDHRARRRVGCVVAACSRATRRSQSDCARSPNARRSPRGRSRICAAIGRPRSRSSRTTPRSRSRSRGHTRRRR